MPSDSETVEEQQLEGPWVLLLDEKRWRDGVDRPVLEQGIESREKGHELLHVYAKNDASNPSNYTLIRPERIAEKAYDVRVD